MTQHVYARIVGFKLAVIPRAPFRIMAAYDPPNAIDVEYFSPNGDLFARVIPSDGGYKSKIDQYTRSLNDVLEIDSGPDTDDWRIETSVFTCDWPRDYALCSNNFPIDPAPFDLLGPNREMIYIQHSEVVPDIETMRAPYQSVISIERSHESTSMDLAYDYDGIEWRQRHEIMQNEGRRFVVTMQAPLPFAKHATEVAYAVARSLRPYEVS